MRAVQLRNLSSVLTGWQARDGDKSQFTTGDFAEAKDLEFVDAFAADGTITQSSNYDAACLPVPPECGI